MPHREPPIDSTIDVITPENISFQYEVAGPFRRLPALFIDVLIRFAVWIGTLLLIGLSGLLGSGFAAIGMAIWLLLWFAMEWFYGGILETYWNGQTVGKRLMSIRVLSTDGQPINGLQAVMRNILRLVDLMPLVPLGAYGVEMNLWAIPTGLIGLIAPMLNDRFQRLGDIVCGTMVVVEDRKWLLGTAKLEDARVKQLAGQFPVQFVASRKLGQALAAYVERRRYLSAARRQEIAEHLTRFLRPRLEVPADVNDDLLLCALYYRTFVADPSQDTDQRLLSDNQPSTAGSSVPTTDRVPATGGVDNSSKPPTTTAVSNASSQAESGS